MKEPRWLSLTVVIAIHSDQIKEHGGRLGLRDRGLLESALARPQNVFHYESDADVFQLAAGYGFGIARNHPFVDGNKRVAFQAMYVFLGLNGRRLETDEPDVVRTMLALASGDLDESGLTTWLRDRGAKRRAKP